MNKPHKHAELIKAWANENGVIWSSEMHNAFHDIEMKK